MFCLVDSGDVKEAEESHGGPDVGQGMLQFERHPQGGVTSDVYLRSIIKNLYLSC